MYSLREIRKRMLDFATSVILFGLFLLIETYTRLFDRCWVCGVGFALSLLLFIGRMFLNVWISQGSGMLKAPNLLILIYLALALVFL